VSKAKERQREEVIGRLVAYIRDERIRQALSLNEISVRSGLSHTMVMRVEKRQRTPTIDTLLRVADALGIDLWKLLRDATTGVKE
jgi:transcriptional regulator with XRE-family HTH domain